MFGQMSVSTLLKLMDEKKAKNKEKLFSEVACGYLFTSPDEVPTECACVAITEKKVLLSQTTTGIKAEEDKEIQAVIIVEAFRDADYYKCLTVGELRKFLNNLEDKDNKFVYIVTPNQLEKGWYFPIINLGRIESYGSGEDKKMRTLFGEEIFHLWI